MIALDYSSSYSIWETLHSRSVLLRIDEDYPKHWKDQHIPISKELHSCTSGVRANDKALPGVRIPSLLKKDFASLTALLQMPLPLGVMFSWLEF